MGNLEAAFAELRAIQDTDWIVSEPTEKKRGPKPGAPRKPRSKPASLGAAAPDPQTPLQRQQKRRSRLARERAENIAILDFETDPFDAEGKAKIFPFLAVLYSDKFETVVIWEADFNALMERVVKSIAALSGRFTIYAHNGGRFDYLFFVSKLRGKVSFKGRGIMSASIGVHELRDSFHIIPERLANWQKDKFDYAKLDRRNREKFRDEIIRYCVNDCKYLLDIVKRFIDGFGLKLTIGQAAMGRLKEHYHVEQLTDGFDAYLRQWFFGGRVECLRGRGEFRGAYKLYDTNSMYPYVMASHAHPTGGFWNYTLRYGDIGPDTVFLDVTCKNNGALIGRGPDGETTATIPHGRFRTTIWEYEIARKYKLIDDIKINLCVDCNVRSDFSKFVLPLYDNRLRTKEEIKRLKNSGLSGTPGYFDFVSEDLFYKLLLNNAYGKFAQNPRKFMEHYLTDPDECPPEEWFKAMGKLPDEEKAKYQLPAFESVRYWIWQRPNPGFRYNNVGVAASITGAARATLLEALQHADNPIYCDTDSIICKGLSGVPIDATALGAWDLEDEFSRVIINGKKLYSIEHTMPKARTADQLRDGLSPLYTIKSKGASRITLPEMEHLLQGGEIEKTNRAPTLNRFGEQYYVTRKIRATVPFFEGMHA